MTEPHGRCAPTGMCDVHDLFALLGKAHTMRLLHYISRVNDGPVRFVELQDHLGISPNVLSARLKALAEAGLVTRTAYNEIPPRVDYEATPKARDLKDVFSSLVDWSRRHSLTVQQPEPTATA